MSISNTTPKLGQSPNQKSKQARCQQKVTRWYTNKTRRHHEKVNFRLVAYTHWAHEGYTWLHGVVLRVRYYATRSRRRRVSSRCILFFYDFGLHCGGRKPGSGQGTPTTIRWLLKTFSHMARDRNNY